MTDDQVVRLHRFREDHPDIDVRAPVYTGGGSQVWSAHREGITLSVQYELRDLLDKLDWILAEQGAPAGP